MHSKYSNDNTDPRKILAYKLVESGIDSQHALIIAIDCGLNAVDRNYLVDIGLKGKKLISAENCVKTFYWLGE